MFLKDIITTIIDVTENNSIEPENLNLSVIYEDEHLLIINKKRGMVVYPGPGHPNKTLANGLIYKNHNLLKIPRVGIVHRLDKDTTGLLVVAKTISSYYKLVGLLKLRKITRIYETIVFGKPPKIGVINKPISRHNVQRKLMSVNIKGKKATTRFIVIEQFHHCSHVKVQLETGRTHQIRVHMLHIKHPILGDNVYFSKKSKKISKKILACFTNYVSRPLLHAKTIQFYHPMTNVFMSYTVNLPQDMNLIIDYLKQYFSYKS
ncbi:RluA family pseudouridine synthase [Buchnera aphidicola]|uniref:RluA family pseudouridine synthase n=1 Tax=Buchnera aphidicola TaxID=9 RepID=UPI003464B256